VAFIPECPRLSMFLVGVEVIKRKSKGFEVLARRWVVERTFAWLVKNRRLVVDYEKHAETSETLIYIAMVRLMLKRLAVLPSLAIAS
jgi:putative transposase